MERSEIFEKMIEICKDVFDDENLIITEDSSETEIEKWDSFAYLTLVDELERAFDIAFTLDDIVKSRTLGELLTAVMKHMEKKQADIKNRKLFSKNHIWVSIEGDIATIGLSDRIQEKLGSIMFLNLSDIGEYLTIGQKFGDIESIKTVTDLISPVNGEVVRVNEELENGTDKVNIEPYESWLIKVKVNEVAHSLIDEDAYLSFCDSDDV